MLLGVIPVTVVEGATNHADRVVVGLLRPLMGVRDLGELGVSDLIENPRPDFGSPDLSEELAIALGGHEGQVFLGDPRIAGQEELSEDLLASSPFLRWPRILDETIVGKFLKKYEGAGGDTLFDLQELLACALEVRLGGAALQGWPVANAIEFKIELDAIAADGTDATMIWTCGRLRSLRLGLSYRFTLLLAFQRQVHLRGKLHYLPLTRARVSRPFLLPANRRARSYAPWP